MRLDDRRVMRRAVAGLAAVLAAALLLASPVVAQTRTTVRAVRSAPVLQTPRGDGMVLGTLQPGAVVAVRGRQGAWLQIEPPADGAAQWTVGWIHQQDVEIVSGSLIPTRLMEPRATRPPGRQMIRGFAQAGGTLFAARDSFETILGGRFGPTYGGGGQFLLANGMFVQAGVSRFEKTGSRVVVTASEILRLDAPHTVTVTPIELSVGYRRALASRLAPFVGLGAGWHRFEESTPSIQGADASSSHLGYQVLLGVEYPIGNWLAVAGEAQWSMVPGSLGDAGVSAVFGEEDLGGGAFRIRILVGR